MVTLTPGHEQAIRTWLLLCSSISHGENTSGLSKKVSPPKLNVVKVPLSLMVFALFLIDLSYNGQVSKVIHGNISKSKEF